MKLSLSKDKALRLDEILKKINVSRKIEGRINLYEEDEYKDDLIDLEYHSLVKLYKTNDEIIHVDITVKGKNHLRDGGFTSAYEDAQKKQLATELDEKSKIWSIKSSKWSLGISIGAFILSIISIFKEELLKLIQ